MKLLLAALMFFTRLPLWKIANVPSSYFSRVVEMWSLVGWLTGGVAALVLWAAAHVFPLPIAVILAIIARVLLTGALHEDGLADFCDGMGGGTSRERILAIMKDSHIGTYGVLGLILYFLLLAMAWMSLPVPLLCFVIIAGDAWSKFCSAQIINVLPYARKVEEAKCQVVYVRFTTPTWILALIAGALPAALLPCPLWWAYLAPAIAASLLFALMKRKIGGYTGDCCGACFLISELTFYLTVVAICNCI